MVVLTSRGQDSSVDLVVPFADVDPVSFNSALKIVPVILLPRLLGAHSLW